MKTWEHDFSLTEIIISHGIIFLSRNSRNARNTRNFIIYFPQITQIKMIFTIRIQRFALLLRKNRSTDLHRFLPCGICFLDMKTREHDLFSRSFFSPTNYTNFTPLFSLKCLFIPQIVALRHFFFLDMKTWEHDLLSRNSRFIVGMGIGWYDYAGCCIVYLSYIYSIFMVYL